MDVVAWSQNLTEERCAELGVTKDELLAAADVLGVLFVLSGRSRKHAACRGSRQDQARPSSSTSPEVRSSRRRP